MRVIAAGRASEILDLGGGRVLRRFRQGGDPGREAAVMEHARAHGFPVPEVFDVREDGLVLELVAGPTMATDLRRQPWRLGRQARVLAELHDRLHAIPYESERLLHLDLHPENVLLSSRGAVVIDWTNAQAGDPALDLALTWVIGATVPNLGARAFTRLFLRHVDREAARRALPEAAAYRCRRVLVRRRVVVRRRDLASSRSCPGRTAADQDEALGAAGRRVVEHGQLQASIARGQDDRLDAPAMHGSLLPMSAAGKQSGLP